MVVWLDKWAVWAVQELSVLPDQWVGPVLLDLDLHLAAVESEEVAALLMEWHRKEVLVKVVLLLEQHLLQAVLHSAQDLLHP